MAVETLENLRRLAAHHLPEMKLVHKRVLVLIEDGHPPQDIAQIEGVSEGTVKQRLAVASSEIAYCLGDRDRVNAGMRGCWVGLHLGCCLAGAMATESTA